MRKRRLLIVTVLLAGIAFGAKEIKPGFNLFSKEQDVQLGKEASQQVEKEVQVVRDQELQNYISQLGSRLAKVSQAPEYPYTFKVVAEKGINAFALPGGPVYVHAATIAAADNEAQLAGVLAHEISHVALRHSTNQVSKAYAWKLPLALAGGLGGSGSLLGQLTQLGVGLGLNSIMLKYSRDAEHDADILGARTMAKAGYDPVEMARFFEKLEAEGGGGQGLQFLSDHPNPGNRVKYVSDEVKAMPQRSYSKGSGDFARIRNLAAKVQPTERKRGYNHDPSPDHPHPDLPSSDLREYKGSGFRVSYPANWKPFGSDSGASVTIAPDQGLVRDSRGQVQIGTGAMAGFFFPDSTNITTATDELVQDLQAKNPDMRPLRGQRQKVTVDGSNGESMVLVGSSPFPNQREIDSLLTATRPEGLFYLVLIAPESDYNTLRPTFQNIQSTVRFR